MAVCTATLSLTRCWPLWGCWAQAARAACPAGSATAAHRGHVTGTPIPSKPPRRLLRGTRRTCRVGTPGHLLPRAVCGCVESDADRDCWDAVRGGRTAGCRQHKVEMRTSQPTVTVWPRSRLCCLQPDGEKSQVTSKFSVLGTLTQMWTTPPGPQHSPSPSRHQTHHLCSPPAPGPGCPLHREVLLMVLSTPVAFGLWTDWHTVGAQEKLAKAHSRCSGNVGEGAQ